MDLVKVTTIQVLLGVKLTGEYDPVTQLAIREFQQRNGLVPDGVAGPNTNRALRTAILNRTKRLGAYTKGRASTVLRKSKHSSISAVLPMFHKSQHIKIFKGLEFILNHADVLQIDSLAKLAHFLGQVRQEVGFNYVVSENLNYNVKGLVNTFRFYRDNRHYAEKHGRTSKHRADQVAIANHAYGHRGGNGGPESGDGWRFKGGGTMCTTFLDNHKLLDTFLADNIPHTEIPSFTKQPELKAIGQYAMLCGVAYWADHDLGFLCTGNFVSRLQCDKMTKVINKHTDSYNQRWANTKRFAKLLGVKVV